MARKPLFKKVQISIYTTLKEHLVIHLNQVADTIKHERLQ
jgi:hypothetical protein